MPGQAGRSETTMTTKSTKQTGTKTATKGNLAKTQAKAAKRTAKIAAKHGAIREAAAQTTPSVAKTPQAVPPTPAANSNPLLAGGDFTEALNAATTEQLQEALASKTLDPRKCNRIEIALKIRSEPAKVAPADVAKTVAAVEKGDLTKGVEAPTTGKKKPAAKAPKAEGKMSGLDAAAKVLAESPTPLNAKAIVEQAAAKGYWSSTAATPWATIYAAMLIEARKRGAESRFVKVDRGLWTLTDAGEQAK
jgi:hypothetical protein